MQPELWEATTGYRRDLPAYEQRESITAVPLKLEPFESVFVVFRKPAGAASATGLGANYPEPDKVQRDQDAVDGQLRSGATRPRRSRGFRNTDDWTASDDERIKYYSGTAFYTNSFMLDKLPDREKSRH